ncbi:hypothetical protein TVAG_146420 [Trichomonas vaginalis G3]|uniref:Uncharacterized protein n=1 Tax=Trichomonas vaginalis (strain ATCC PRA-98 / G3) TaxID=412133 RepID=A2DKU6_TRIV3|nr:hypothetical protein TVAGG3_0361290 [Trichomonas vaginalis G3]EAY18899.1 hypothetical protein TVAG_146420 [Trichomonas vaginalis G3]KAI5531954.1 hypothetical protein TVAGG3_0361290 [Trichomonas vaginalis G3]|eukprot:XP_001579885.1 hypothetical protein [Trichomonas vaginalis G3]
MRVYNGKIEFPWYLPVRNNLVMRYLSEEKADIEKFENLMLLRMKHDDEEMMEVVRFLGIFKNQRQKIMIMLSMWKGESVYYDYQFYLASRLFSCFNDNCPEYYINQLDNLHRNYLVCLSMFWKNRHDKNYFTSFLYGTKASVTHVEMINLIEFRSFIYQYDPYIYQSYAEISLIALGDPSKSVIYRRHSQLLKENHYSVVDPVFKATARYYPISIEQYTEEKTSTDSSETNSTSSSNLSSQNSYNHIRFHLSDNVIYRDEESDNSSIAMFVQKSDQMKSMNVLVAVLLTFIWSYFFARDVILSEIENSHRLIDIKNIIKKTMYLNVEVTSIYMVKPIIESKQYHNCFELKSDIYRYLNEYSFSVGDDFTFISKSLSFMSDFLSKSNTDNCYELEIDNNRIISDRLNTIQNNYYSFETKVDEILNRKDLLIIYHKYALYLIVMSIFMSIFSAFMGYMSVRMTLFDLPENALSFLGSKERLSMLLLKKSLESWDFFRILFPFEKNENENQTQHQSQKLQKSQKNSESSSKISLIRSRKNSMSKYGSDTNINNPNPINQQTNVQRHNIIPKGNTKSRHVNLKESKIAISFIGSDESLKASQFALMQNIVQKSTNTNSNPDINIYPSLISSDNSDDCSSASGSTNNTKDFIPAETVEERDIVKETIDKTKISDTRVLVLIFSTHIIPWIIILLIVAYSNLILNFQMRCENIFVSNIRPNITDLHQLPLRIYGDFINKSNNKNTELHKHDLNFSSYEIKDKNQYFTKFDSYFHSHRKRDENSFEIKEIKINSNISFYTHRLEHFIEDTERVNSISMTTLVSFCIVSTFIWFSTNIAVYKIESFIIRGFNSLFHFPLSYLDIINKPLDTSRHSSVPNNCIEVIFDNETKLISDISENISEHIGISSIDVIGHKYEDIFTREEEGIVSFSINQKKSKKFIEDKIEDKLITRIALIPSKSDDLHDINISHQNLTIILNSIFHHQDFLDCFVVLIHFDSSTFNSCVDQIFFATHNILQCYGCCKLLNIEGSLVYFSIEDDDINAVYLFIRDMLNNSTPTTRNSLKSISKTNTSTLTTTKTSTKDVSSTQSSSITSVVFCRTRVHIGISVGQEFDSQEEIQNVPFASISFSENDFIRHEIFSLEDHTILFYDEHDSHKNIISFDDLNIILENEN